MTKTERLTNLQRKENRISASLSPKRRKRNLIVYAILIVGTVLSCIIGTTATSSQIEKQYRQAIENPSLISVDILDYKDIFDVWNREVCRNDINTLLSGGNIYIRNELMVLPSPSARNRYIVSNSGKKIGQINSNISSINLLEDSIYYKDNRTKQIMVFNLTTAKSSVFLAESVGSFLISSNKLYYTDLSKNSSLFSVGIGNVDVPILLVNGPIDQFVVLGESILFRGYDNVLYLLSTESNSMETVGKGIERFFLDGDLILESGNAIYKAKPNGTKPEKIYESNVESFNVVGAYSGMILYQEDGLLYQIKRTGEIEAINTSAYSNYCSITINDGRLYALGIRDETSKEATFELVELPFTETETHNGQ